MDTNSRKGLLITGIALASLFLLTKKGHARYTNMEGNFEADVLKLFIAPVKNQQADSYRQLKRKQAIDDISFYIEEIYRLQKKGNKILFAYSTGSIQIIYDMFSGDIEVVSPDRLAEHAARTLQEAIGIIGKKDANAMFLLNVKE